MDVSDNSFFATMPGFRTDEIEPWIENGEIWRGLRVIFPYHIASHSIVLDFYFGEDFLLRRQDYLIDVAGEFHAAQYMYDFVDVQGLKFPSKRRAYKRGEGGKPILDELMISIDLFDFQLI
jgi:hypothetical protein